MKQHRTFARVISIVGGTICFLQLALLAVREIAQHRGYETYRNIYGLQIIWVSFLITMASVGLVMAVALVASAWVRWRDRREELKIIDELERRNLRHEDGGSV